MLVRQLVDHSPISLENVTARFRRFRRDHQGKRFIPSDLQEIAVRSVASGETIEAVAIAAGVCSGSIRNWLKKAEPKARQLSIVPDRAVAKETAVGTRVRVLIIDLSSEDVSSGLLSKLARIDQ